MTRCRPRAPLERTAVQAVARMAAAALRVTGAMVVVALLGSEAMAQVNDEAMASPSAMVAVRATTTASSRDATSEETDDLDSLPVGQVIDEYVREALRSNLSLQAESLEVDRNMAALDAARARFLPTVALEARYSRSEGGRELNIPVGTVVNPVYSTLNQLL